MSTLSLNSQIYIILVYEKCECGSGTALKTLYFNRLDKNIIILSFWEFAWSGLLILQFIEVLNSKMSDLLLFKDSE